MTGATDDRFQIPERGYLREDYFADLTVFDEGALKNRRSGTGQGLRHRQAVHQRRARHGRRQARHRDTENRRPRDPRIIIARTEKISPERPFGADALV